MKDNYLRIEEALVAYNSNPKRKKPLRWQELAVKLFDGEGISVSRSRAILSSWKQGRGFSRMEPKHVRRLCEILTTTPNQLFGIT
jgi:hypothetical protein